MLSSPSFCATPSVHVHSQRSCSEVQSQLYVALDQSYITQEEFDSIYNQAALTHGKVGGFIRYLLNTPNPR